MKFGSLIALLVKGCALAIIYIGLATISCFAQSIYYTVSHTPYDRQMVRVSSILASTNGQRPNQISSLSAVSQWMSDLRTVPYQYSKHWQTPAEINLEQAADCKGKAVALYAQMRRNGAKNLRVVIGKHHIHDSATHAWLEWETSAGNYVLDPTFNEIPARKADLSAMTYVPLYAFDGEHKYRAVNSGFVTPNARVAVDYGNHLYVPASTGSTLAHSGRISVGPKQSFPAKPKYATPSAQHRQSNHRYPASNFRQHRPGPITVKSTARTQVHARPRSIQRCLAPNVRRSLPHAMGIRQPRSFDQYSPPVIRMQPAPATAASEL